MIKATITVQINLRLNVAFAQIKFLKAQVAELEKNSSRGSAGNENEWRADTPAKIDIQQHLAALLVSKQNDMEKSTAAQNDDTYDEWSMEDASTMLLSAVSNPSFYPRRVIELSEDRL